jgi:hypothetical protein
MIMELINVVSSNIASIGWQANQLINDASQPVDILRIVYKNGLVYDYYNVHQKDYEAFLASESKGQFYHKNIKGRYREARVN